MDDLRREIGRLEARLASPRVVDELSRVRRDLGSAGDRRPALRLADLRVASPCKERWADMVGDDRVRACNGCDRPVFNLSEMTHDEAEALLATRGVTPCVRFYRRADGTIITSDCPTGARREVRRLRVVASTLAAGTTLAGASAMADPAAPAPAVGEPASSPATPAPTTPDPCARPDDEAHPPIDNITVTMGELIAPSERPRPAIEWSTWARLGYGVASQQPGVVARGITPPVPETAGRWEAALAADVSASIAQHGNLRLGAWGEMRTSSGPVLGGELIVQGLPPTPFGGDFDGTGSIVLRVGANEHVVTTALGFGYIGSWDRGDPETSSVRHIVGVRLVGSMDRSLDDPRSWSATVGIELEPIGVLQYAVRAATR